MALLGHVAGAIETGFHKGSWRNPSASDARWLRFLASNGYTLAEVEQQIVDAIDARTSDHASERSATAAEQSAMAADRSAAVAEREEQRQRRDAEERAVRWRAEKLGSAAVILRNSGDGTAYDVTAEVREGAQIVGGPQVNGATVGLLRLQLTLVLRDLVPREGCRCAQEVPAGVQA